MDESKLEQILDAHTKWLSFKLSGVRADLGDANLSDSNLSRANLSRANLRGANLRGANLASTNFRWADLSYADFGGANLRGTILRGATLTAANLSGADLQGAILPDFQIPQDGSLTVWKKLSGGVLAKLLVPANARRTASLVGRKCRAEFAVVLNLSRGFEKVSMHNCLFRYRVGMTVKPDLYDDDIRIECAHGIHFFLTKEEAERW